MRILLVHNKYQQAGGEDLVFETEGELLVHYNHLVERLIFDNKEIRTLLDKFLIGLKGLYNPDSSRKLEDRIKRFKPDIIHVHNFVPLASPSIFYAAKRNKIPVVVTLHNYRMICPSATLFYDHQIYEKSVHSVFPLNAIYKGVYRNSRIQTAGMVLAMSIHNLIGTWRNKVNKFIVLTEFARNKFTHSALRVSADQFLLKPNFIKDPGNGEANRDNFFLFIGRLSEEKGIDTLLNAAKLHNFKLVIIGDGPLRKKVEEFSAATSNIDYRGFQQKPVILDVLKKCKALLFPSVWYEGFPLTILEAFATGTPVIGSRIGGVAEIVTDNFNGLHFEAGNENDMIRKITQMEQIGLAKKLSENARNTYLERYTPERNYKTLMEIYDGAIASALKIE
jgi:glycosyltransferase involved in cell wall biosynthesis